MTNRKKNSPVFSVPANTSFPPRTEIRPVSVLPNRKTPYGYVAHCWPCNWSTSIMCDEVSFDPKAIIETGYEAAKRLLNDHLRECPHHISVTNRTRPETDPA